MVADVDEFDDEDLVEEEKVAVTLTHLGYIKRVPADTYKAQKRGGKGITGITTRENDFVKDLIMTSTHDYLMFFTNTGKAHKIKLLRFLKRPERQEARRRLTSESDAERADHCRHSVQEFSDDKYLIAVTKNGTIKKTPLSQFDTQRKTGLIAINLKDDDQLIGIKETNGHNNVIIVTKNGKSICFSEEDVRSMGRIAGGVRAIKLEKDDEVVAMELVEPGQELLVVTENGFGKRTPVSDYKVQVRGGKGILTYDKAKFKKTGALIGAMVVDDDDEILMINSEGIIIRIHADEVSKLGRATQGVKIMKVDDDTKIVAMAKVIRDDEEDGENKDEKEKKPDKDEQLSL